MRFAALPLFILFLVLTFVLNSSTQAYEKPPTFAPFAQIETHRIRIVNSVDGAIQISDDKGKTWHLIGRVTAPATQSLMGYSASGYAQPGTVAATAVHGLRIRVGDLDTPDPLLINILPREFAQTPKLFGGHVSGLSGIYTTIQVGTSIFRELCPFVGNPVFLEGAMGAEMLPLPLNYQPHEDDVLILSVRAPANPLKEVFFGNVPGGDVRVTYADGTTKVITHVVKPVTGVGRYDGCSYTGVGALNTNHDGVLTVSTAPVTTSSLFEGIGPERRGGFQIQPAYHNAAGDGAGAASVLVIGSRKKPTAPEMEGTPPLFYGYFDLAWGKDQPGHSWRTEIQRKRGPWSPMPTLIGDQPLALLGVTALRLVRTDQGDAAWRKGQIKIAEKAYAAQAEDAARAGRTPIVRGEVALTAAAPDRRTAFVSFYVDGDFKSITNSVPYSFTWNTRQVPDGEYVVEAQTQDALSHPLTTTRTKLWVDNSRRLLSPPPPP
jgi:hypothetical protein